APAPAAEWVEQTLSSLSPRYRLVLELRFLRGYSLLETAIEMGKTVGGIKVMQLRALRAAARVGAEAPHVSRSAVRSLQSRRGLDRARLVAAVVEDDQHVPLAHIDELLSGDAPLHVDERDARPQQVKLAGQVARELAADPPAQDEHPLPDVGQQGDRLLEVVGRELLDGCLQIAARDVQGIGKQRAGAPACFVVSVPLQR